MNPRKARLPAAVLDRARKVSVSSPPRPAPAPKPRPDASNPRDKIVQALKKLHPMD